MNTEIQLNLTPTEFYYIRTALEREVARLESKGLENSDKHEVMDSLLDKMDALSKLMHSISFGERKH